MRCFSSAKAGVTVSLLTITPEQSQGEKKNKNERERCSAAALELCVHRKSQNTLSFCLPGKASCCLLRPSWNGLIEILLLGKAEESWKVTPIYLKCLIQVHLHTKKPHQKVAIHYSIIAIVCSVISDDR